MTSLMGQQEVVEVLKDMRNLQDKFAESEASCQQKELENGKLWQHNVKFKERIKELEITELDDLKVSEKVTQSTQTQFKGCYINKVRMTGVETKTDECNTSERKLDEVAKNVSSEIAHDQTDKNYNSTSVPILKKEILVPATWGGDHF